MGEKETCVWALGGGGFCCGCCCCCGLIGCFLAHVVMLKLAIAAEEVCERIEVGHESICVLASGLPPGLTCAESCEQDVELPVGEEGEVCRKSSDSTISCCSSEVHVEFGLPVLGEPGADDCTLVKFNNNGAETPLNTPPNGRRLTRPGLLRGAAATTRSNASRLMLGLTAAAPGPEGPRRLDLGEEEPRRLDDLEEEEEEDEGPREGGIWCVFAPWWGKVTVVGKNNKFFSYGDGADELFVGWTKNSASKECHEARDTVRGIAAALLGSGIGATICCLCCCCTTAFSVALDRRQRSLRSLPAFNPPQQPPPQGFPAQPAAKEPAPPPLGGAAQGEAPAEAVPEEPNAKAPGNGSDDAANPNHAPGAAAGVPGGDAAGGERRELSE